MSHWKRAVNALDFSLITGAADDDPSGITTYSIAGAQFGTLQASLFTQAIGQMQPHAKSVSVRAKRPWDGDLRTTSRQSEAEAKHYQSLLNLMRENPWCLLHVGDIRLLFQIPVHTMVRLRKLAAKDPETDPWIADSTTALQFHNWLWEIRRALEKKYPEI